MKTDRGYTVFELIISIIGVGCLALLGLGIYVLAHFISKHW